MGDAMTVAGATPGLSGAAAASGGVSSGAYSSGCWVGTGSEAAASGVAVTSGVGATEDATEDVAQVGESFCTTLTLALDGEGVVVVAGAVVLDCTPAITVALLSATATALAVDDAAPDDRALALAVAVAVALALAVAVVLALTVLPTACVVSSVTSTVKPVVVGAAELAPFAMTGGGGAAPAAGGTAYGVWWCTSG